MISNSSQYYSHWWNLNSNLMNKIGFCVWSSVKWVLIYSLCINYSWNNNFLHLCTTINWKISETSWLVLGYTEKQNNAALSTKAISIRMDKQKSSVFSINVLIKM